jgi:Spy/CpxP family protein refolding chaperone
MKGVPSRAALLVAATGLLATTAVHAGEPAQREGAVHHRSRESRLQERLGLTDEQVQAIRDIHARDAEDSAQNRQALVRAHGELRRLILGQADEPVIEAKRAEVERLMVEGLHRRVNTLKTVTPLLTPEQREKYATLAEQAWRRRPHPPRPS